MRCRDQDKDLCCIPWPEIADVRRERLPARAAVRIQVGAVPAAQACARRKELGARIGVVAREARLEVDAAVQGAQVF
jgi:hypothetical protein